MPIDDLIDEIICITSDNYEKCILLMIECLPLIIEECPDIGIEGINTANKYWIEKNLNQTELEKARVDCWRYLDSKSASTNTVNPQFCAIRAVICVLYSVPPSEDNGELLDWFFKMITLANKNHDKLLNNIASTVEAFKTKTYS